MIQATDLRIGNLIQLIYESKRPSLEERIVRVDRIDEMGVEILENGARVFGSVYELLEGIPLTEEILLKCGFEKDEVVKCLYHLKIGNVIISIAIEGSFLLDITFANTNITAVTIEPSNCEYLHQLQNITHALTNTELNIKL